ncbi:MAG: hypothetical protein A2W23_03100 [Planctomycetes bacterium RBG_16_43_13]|nr:MAG: hypothetical protein A2W23_03100 [Planctomycetes bacterium RBG_16_43_13]
MADKERNPVPIPLTGRWRTSVDGTQLSEGDFQVLTNMRYTNAGIRSVSGMTKINPSTALTYPLIRAAHHFVKDEPSESHLLVQSWNSGGTASKIYRNDTTIPSQGDFNTTALYTESSGAGIGTFSNAPDGCVAYCNGKESLIWGGDEYRCGAFFNFKGADEFVYNYSKAVSNTLQTAGNIAILKQASAAPTTTVRLGSVLPIRAIKFYVKVANATAAVAGISVWAGSSYHAVTNMVDNTSVSGKALAQTGTVTFDSTVAVAKISILYNIAAYWYTITWTGLDQDVEIYYVTVDVPMQPIKDIWNGYIRQIYAFFEYSSSIYTDATFNVINDSYVNADLTTYNELDSLATSGYIVAGFLEPQMGLRVKLVPKHVNTTAATTATVSYWNGVAWGTVGTISDGTKANSISFNQSGLITWQAITPGGEQTTSISTNENPLYYYKISFDKALSGDVQLYYIGGIPAQKQVSNYKFPINFHNRLWLCSDQSGQRNKITASSTNTVSIFNGSDTADFFLGDNMDIIAGGALYTRYGSSLYENLMLCKEEETWLIDGTSLNTYALYKISDQYGCVAKDTFQICSIGFEIAQGINKHVAIWQAAGAIVIFDGSSVIPIHLDIENVFDPTSSLTINISMIHKSASLYDEAKMEYHWLWASGSNTTLNKEYVFDLLRRKWFEIDRGSGKYLQLGISVSDGNGYKYVYGAIDSGYLERLEYGTTFDSNNITSQFETPDIPLGGWNNEVILRNIRLIAKSKGTTVNSVIMTHYGDMAISGTTIGSFSVTDTTHRVVNNMKSINTGPHTFHRFACSMTTNDENIGFEPIGLEVFWKHVREKIM